MVFHSLLEVMLLWQLHHLLLFFLGKCAFFLAVCVAPSDANSTKKHKNRYKNKGFFYIWTCTQAPPTFLRCLITTHEWHLVIRVPSSRQNSPIIWRRTLRCDAARAAMNHLCATTNVATHKQRQAPVLHIGKDSLGLWFRRMILNPRCQWTCHKNAHLLPFLRSKLPGSSNARVLSRCPWWCHNSRLVEPPTRWLGTGMWPYCIRFSMKSYDWAIWNKAINRTTKNCQLNFTEHSDF